MPSPAPATPSTEFTATAKTLAAAAGLVCGLILAGWLAGLRGLESWLGAWGTMRPIAALGFGAASLGLWLLAEGERGRRPGRAAAWLALVIGGLNWCVQDGWPAFAPEAWWFAATACMPSAASVCLLLLGASQLGLDHRVRGDRIPTHAFAVFAALTAIFALQGTWFESEAWIGRGPFQDLSPVTSTLILALAVGVLFARRGGGSLQVLASEGPGGRIARRLLPVVLLIPLVAESFRRIGLENGWFDEPFARACQSALRILVAGYLVWRVSVGLDRTEALRLAADASLREEEKGAREALEALPQIVWTCAPDGRCDYLGPQWCRYTGTTVAAGLGDGWLDRLHPEEQERARLRWRETAAAGRPFDIELRLLRHDGVHRWFKTRAEPLRGADGRIRKWFGTHTDIDDRVRAEAALAESNARTEAIFRASHDAFLIADLDGRILDANPAATRLLGHEREDLLALDLARIEPKGRLASAARLLARSLVREGELFETRLNARDGRTVDVEAAVAPLHRAGEVRMIAALRDITGRRKAAEALRQTNDELERRVRERTAAIERSNRDLEQFAYVASHDLQEPLRAVAGCAQLLKRRYAGRLDAGADELVNHLVAGAVRMQTLIHDLLTYARLDRRDTSGNEADTALAFKEALAHLEVSIRESGATVTLEGELPRVRADRAQVVLLFQNLLGNALKYRSAAAPRIRVWVTHSGADWEFAVEDNGIGIEPRHQERIFVIFQRLHAQGEYAGTGIGLAVCKKIAERHGGRIWVESQPGLGSTFRFTLPAVPPT